MKDKNPRLQIIANRGFAFFERYAISTIKEYHYFCKSLILTNESIRVYHYPQRRKV